MLLDVRIKEAGYQQASSVIKHIHFSVRRGELVGLIGPNGAGKSTTIKTILGIMKHVKGTIHAQDFAYIPERPIFYDRLTLWEHIEFLFSTLALNEKDLQQQAEELLKIFQLSHVIHQFPESFSKGMQQKCMLILAFLKKPDLYIIDEPFMGLDPKATKRLLDLLKREQDRGAGILMSTHVLDTAEKVCDRFVLLSNGQLVLQGTLDEIRVDSGLEDGSLFDCFDVCTERDIYVS
ncbi:ABC-2 type transport system ATP-binding protein [Bacillus mesophilus]|uniref:ABC transporter ATP-binding protein n=1 Tax=Bacillus mesophilus TaxID=1808955 RepID=A0A6M0QAR2_9BACI|nr:ABC transporter ATP-binding protein [Bacillus mesophilus]MBM7662846.1 ABC-2 type transport system ATP-binding protein [Bacillus mesophilus]NEY73436.1 ABC transporter ATP-binding protein [Bacillus mesophilus]